jgi:hypothetical protein
MKGLQNKLLTEFYCRNYYESLTAVSVEDVDGGLESDSSDEEKDKEKDGNEYIPVGKVAK